MTEISQGTGYAATSPKERLFKDRRRGIPAHKVGTVVRALWPTKPALNFAQRIGCTERAAQFYIDGERKLSLKAALVIIGELIE